MKAHSRETVQLAEQAADWVTRLDDEPTPACHAELVTWLRMSPAHIEEFLLAQATYRAFHEAGSAQDLDMQALLAADAGKVIALREQNPVAPHNGKRFSGWTRMAAVVAFVAIGTGAWLATSWLTGDVYTTSIGEQRTVRLEDGSLLTLNTNSRVKVDFSDTARGARLVRGEALFEVTPDAQRPFGVRTPSAMVQVLGTRFNVYERAGGAQVCVLEGLVQLTAADSATVQTIAAGQQADVTADGKVIFNPQADLTQATAWRERRLVFRGTPLADVVREFNRYTERPIRLQDGTLGQRKISGVFHADDPGTIFKFLRTESAVKVEEKAREIVIRAK
jgi:transmembrane sensor